MRSVMVGSMACARASTRKPTRFGSRRESLLLPGARSTSSEPGFSRARANEGSRPQGLLVASRSQVRDLCVRAGRARSLEQEEESQFRRNTKAWKFFQAQPAGYRHLVIWRIITAKRSRNGAGPPCQARGGFGKWRTPMRRNPWPDPSIERMFQTLLRALLLVAHVKR